MHLGADNTAITFTKAITGVAGAFSPAQVFHEQKHPTPLRQSGSIGGLDNWGRQVSKKIPSLACRTQLHEGGREALKKRSASRRPLQGRRARAPAASSEPGRARPSCPTTGIVRERRLLWSHLESGSLIGLIHVQSMLPITLRSVLPRHRHQRPTRGHACSWRVFETLAPMLLVLCLNTVAPYRVLP